MISFLLNDASDGSVSLTTSLRCRASVSAS
jgi:hypothetical protein